MAEIVEVRTATYGPGIDQSQHAKSVSHIVITIMFKDVLRTFEAEILKIFIKEHRFSLGPKIRRSYRKECMSNKCFTLFNTFG